MFKVKTGKAMSAILEIRHFAHTLKGDRPSSTCKVVQNMTFIIACMPCFWREKLAEIVFRKAQGPVSRKSR